MSNPTALYCCVEVEGFDNKRYCIETKNILRTDFSSLAGLEVTEKFVRGGGGWVPSEYYV